MLWQIEKVFSLNALWKVGQVLSCLQHSLNNLGKHVGNFPLLNPLRSKFFLLSKTLLSPIMSHRFLFLFNAKIGGIAKVSFNLVSVC